jgi:hypothetical protein
MCVCFKSSLSMGGVDVACNDPIEDCEENPNQALCLYINQVDVYTMDAPLMVFVLRTNFQPSREP